MTASLAKLKDNASKSAFWTSKKPERLTVLLFLILYCIVSAFHEPWFDEAQAWEIAKGASLKEILFSIPHYEGHPPLWHLILLIPAKIGIPFELGLKTVGAVISVSTAYLLLFRSHLPRVARIALPFSYFFFYQYGVIVRPYGLMILIFLVLGMNFSHRKEHPWRIIILLGILCLCSAYGIVISGGIALCLVLEMLQEKEMKKSLIFFITDSRILSLLVLLFLALLLVAEIIPRTDTYYAAYNDKNPFFLCFICALLTFPAECFLTSASWFSIDRTLLQTSNIDTRELILLCIIGLILWVFIICSASRKNLMFLLIPYAMLAAFSAGVYFSGHHLGVVFMFFLFWAEFVCREENCFEIGKALMKQISEHEHDEKLLKRAAMIVGIACLFVPIVWTIIASVHDVKYQYYFSREVAAFLKKHGLEDNAILASWHEYGSTTPFSEGDEGYVNTAMIGNAVPINAYYDKNIFFNLNNGDPDKGFIYHRRPTHLESEKTLKVWRTFGTPDMIIGKPNLKIVYGDNISYNDYKLVLLGKSRFIWKAGMVTEAMPVFLRKDLLDEYGIVALEGIKYTSVNGISITDEMKERFYSGEPIEEILKPYLDAMFGEE